MRLNVVHLPINIGEGALSLQGNAKFLRYCQRADK